MAQVDLPLLPDYVCSLIQILTGMFDLKYNEGNELKNQIKRSIISYIVRDECSDKSKYSSLNSLISAIDKRIKVAIENVDNFPEDI